jgi:hypothetical protein
MDLAKLIKELEQALIAAQDEVLRREGALMLARQLLAHAQAEATKAEADKAEADKAKADKANTGAAKKE